MGPVKKRGVVCVCVCVCDGVRGQRSEREYKYLYKRQ